LSIALESPVGEITDGRNYDVRAWRETEWIGENIPPWVARVIVQSLDADGMQAYVRVAVPRYMKPAVKTLPPGRRREGRRVPGGDRRPAAAGN